MDAINTFVLSLITHPLVWIGYFFAFAAALAFLVFLRGFLSGVPHFFTLSAREDYQLLHRIRVTWGIVLLVFILAIWELLRLTINWISSFFA